MRIKRFVWLANAAVLCTCTFGVAQAKSAPATAPTAAAATKPPATTTSTAPATTPTDAAKGLAPVFRNIRTFQADVAPLFRNIRTFWSGLNPTTSSVGAFWGDLNPAFRNIRTFSDNPPSTQITGSFQNIGAFWDTNGALWSNSMTLWSKVDAGTATTADRQTLQTNLNTLISNANTFWGSAVTTRLGGTFQTSFANPLLTKYGISTRNPQSVIGLAADRRVTFFQEWFDGLNGFTGYDQVDGWMLQANWSPHLSNIQGGGAGVIVGLVDTRLAGDADLLGKLRYNGGSTAFSNVHGTAVASLIAASHDGRNIMGIAPNVQLAAYNPYDANAVASWRTVSTGIDAVVANGASVVNLSLGEPGVAFSPKWDNAFKDAAKSGQAVFVIAAGNDGLTQTKNVAWNQGKAISLLVVGSVDHNNVISAFSNRPGNACLRINGACDTKATFGNGGLLMNYFLVAPGENVLASNGQGGVARYSGTSLAAPQVTGAVALLQGRWPWLKQFPLETAQIILRSAKDLGAPGVDPVYGWGLLDVQASQAPLNFNNLVYYTVRNGVSTAQTVSAVRSSTNRAAWAAQGAYINAFEVIGGTSRDFLLPISAGLVGTKVGSVYFQDFVQNRLVAWASAPALTDVGGHLALSDRGRETALPGSFGFKMSLRSRLVPIGPSERAQRNFRADTSITLGDARGRFSFTIGQGSNTQNALQSGFGLESDYAPLDGGVNPILGFASGGAHLRTSVALRPDLRVTFGNSQTRVDGPGTSAPARGGNGADIIAAGTNYRAAANTVQLDYSPRPWLSLNATYTALNEAGGLLGVRSESADGLIGGARSAALTLGASLEPMPGLLLSASSTRSTSRSNDAGAALRTGIGGLRSSAFAVAIAKTGLLGKSDQLRLSVAQPLAVSQGSLDLTTLAVIDRTTGALGSVTQSLGVQERARMVGEVNYGMALPQVLGEVSFFGRGDFRPEARNSQGVAAGARIRLAI